MKIANKKTTSKVGRPSLRSFTARRSDHHITFSSKTANELGLEIGMKVNISFDGKNTYLCFSSEYGCILYGYKNGKQYTSYACTANNAATKLLDSINATKVATFLIAANYEIINGYKCYKVISTPLRVD